jgi:hypothetical protein
MYARLTTGTLPVERVKEAGQVFAEKVVPRSKEIPGVKNLYGLVDEASGKLVALVLYETEADLVASRDMATKLREEVVKAVGGTISSVEEFEVIAQV